MIVKGEVSWMYECLNCGFKFNNPAVIWKRTPLVDLWLRGNQKTFYYATPVCPKCGSDKIEKGSDDG